MEFLGIDWGSRRFRAWLLDSEGRIIDSVEKDEGLAAVRDRDFRGALEAACAAQLSRDPNLPILLSGMVGSRTGWIEAPYCPCPATMDTIAGNAIRFEIGSHPAAILPGATSVDASGHADVMRGEEIQVLGVAALLGIQDATICIPGTHAKWASLSAGRLANFETHVTGEMFSLLRGHSLVGQMAEGDDDAPEAFLAGVDHGLTHAAAHAVFAARADALQGTLAPRSISAFLSGVLIGNELSARPRSESGELVLLATGVLAERYAKALTHVGEVFRTVDAKEAARAGQVLAARALWPDRVSA
ncbi:2-dehydro-3-deoxygalactonokinase [Rhizobium sp. SSA_523]|uniref:2-dehydro-3-deoxygalactonokinase n=1 Tax=Rhizobium sp. SSA_523 TaxID=2952477 RepID=UPI00209051EA|nr:2-dehydro-3-deoxygalactonokinase [Rhizobium sp. SSA_523]MCO5732200.1 2-dehydro-3-deoxygalactonokinase [Rhizobium sp. SSA_523]WKC21386.1 2-dehydro-3-deoxygalactonokinase [Rhizobium sp. SSA_523]